LQLLKQRVSQLENTAQQTDVVRQENALLRQQLLEMEAAVRDQPQQLHMSPAVHAMCYW
jgi:cell shape-determining protein MreC